MHNRCMHKLQNYEITKAILSMQIKLILFVQLHASSILSLEEKQEVHEICVYFPVQGHWTDNFRKCLAHI